MSEEKTKTKKKGGAVKAAKRGRTVEKKDGVEARRGRMGASEDGRAVFESGASAARPAEFDALEVCELMNLYHLPERGDSFVRRTGEGRWSVWTKDAVVDGMRALPGRLIAIKARDGEQLSESKQVLHFAREHRALDGMLPALPGYKCGLHDLEDGKRVVVRSEPRLVEAKEGTWDHIRLLVENLLDRSGEPGGVNQATYFYAWCQVAARAIREGIPGHWRQGHALILTGPAGCGKNRLQEQIITPLLGGYGRAADPAKFLFEGDEFNGDVFCAEHLMLSEIPTPSQKTLDRTSLAEKIKQVVANPVQRMRLMRTEPASVSPFWRLSISVNDDKDKLRSLPLITGDFGDKVLIFHCARKPLPIIERDSIESQKLFRDVMAAELPGFLWWLLNEFVVPEELLTYADGRSATRFGFREYHAPIIKEGLFDETPHAELLRLIDMAVFTVKEEWRPDVESPLGSGEDGALKLWDLVGDREATDGRGNRLRMWWGRAESLQMLLCGEGEYGCSVVTLARKFFQHSPKCGTMLGRLHDDEGIRGVRIDKKNTEHWKGWVIGPPQV